MKKGSISAISAIASIFFISCQLQVAPVRAVEDNTSAGGTASRTIYASGSAYMENDLYRPVVWINGAPQLLPLPADKTGGETFALQISAGKIYIAGHTKDAENRKHPYLWKASSASGSFEPTLLPVPLNHTGGDPAVTALFIENETVYIAGTLVDNSDPENPQRKFCYWINGESPAFLTQPESFSMGGIGLGGLWVQNETVYIAGTVNSEAYVAPYLWKNGSPIPLSLPPGVTNGRVYGVHASGGFLYLAGYYVDSSTAIPCYWKFSLSNETSSPIFLSGYTPGTPNFAIVPFVDGSTIYMGGGIGIPNQDGWIPTYWKNGIPTPVPFPANQNVGLVTGLTTKDGIVYITGFYGDPEGNGSEAFIWRGATKIPVTSPVGSQGTLIYAFAVE